MSVRFLLSDVAKSFAETIFKEFQTPLAKAATAAVREAGELAKRDGRASIAAAGFSRKWQNALRVNLYPPQGDSLRPAAFIFHKIRYAGVFEDGAIIGGQPFLWLPLETVPLRRGQPVAPSQYVKSVGPLVSVQRPGGPPLLFPKYRSARRRGGKTSTRDRKPLYVGLTSIAIAKRFNIKGAAQSAAAQLPSLFEKHLRSG